MSRLQVWAGAFSTLALLSTSSCAGDDDGDDAAGGAHTGGSSSGGFRTVASGGYTAPSSGGQLNTGGQFAGTGGAASGGSDECGVCDNSQACCLAIAHLENLSTAPCLTFSSSTCNSLSGPARAATVTACQNYLQMQMTRDLAACR